MPIELWLGPVIVAAIVSGLVNAAGWFVTFRQSRQLEQLRRDEKVNDFQVALRAEIASDVLGMSVFDRSELLQAVREKYLSDPHYTVLVPHLATNVIFDAVVKEIHILPGEVIGPVVSYERLRQTADRFAADMRATSFSQLPAARQLSMYTDYLEMIGRLEDLARRALIVIENSLGLSSPVADQSTPPSGAAARELDGGQASASSQTNSP